MIGRSPGPNDGSRPEATSTTPTPPHAISDHRNVPTVAVVGLSGPDSIKGAAGVGKSLLCNRFVRPNFGDFYEDHISTLSQTDFGGSPVINSDHWLYWGEGELETEDLMHGKTTHVRVIEQTEFLDDETFDTISSGSLPPYSKRATKTKLESRDKLMYICKEQLGLETDFDQRVLPEGKTNVDAFIVVFDVSPVPHRSLDRQIDVLAPILTNVLKTKKPAFLAATKCDRSDGNGLKALQRLLQRKEFKGVNIPVVEVSALENVNVTELLSLVAHTVDKCRCRPKLLPYSEAVRLHIERRIVIRKCYSNLLRELMPLNEWPTKRATWKQLTTRYNLAHHPNFDHFVATFGIKAAQEVYKQYVNEAREHWMQAKLQSHLPRLQHVFAQLIGMERVCDLEWSQAAALIKAHPLYDEYFQPLGNLANEFDPAVVVDRGEVDSRLPTELLLVTDAHRSFHAYQKAVEKEFRRERQEEDFARLLADCSQVTPGCPLSDVQLFLQGSPAFDCLQFNHAQLVYDRYQSDLIKKAELDFTELLLEQIHLFMEVVLARRSGGAHNRPLLGLDEDEMTMIRHILQEDLRYRQLSRLFELRDKMISEYACFISYPLVQNCHAQARCVDVVVHEAFPSQFHRRKSCDKSSVISLELVVVGRDPIASEFVNALRRMETLNGAIECEYGLVRMRCRVMDYNAVPRSNELSQSVVILIDSAATAECARQFLSTAKIHFPPIFLPLCDPSHFDLLPSLHLQVNQLAEGFGGIFLASSRDFDEMDGCLQNSSDELSPMFRRDYVARVLSSVCCSQLDNRRVDLRVQFSLMCGDQYPLASLLSGIFTACSPAIQSSASAGFATVDVALSNPKRPVRVSLRVCAYHSWLLNKQIQPIHGHVLVYSARRRASLAHAAAAAHSLVAGAAPGTEQAVGQSILIIAVADVTDFFNDEDANALLTEGSELANRIGAVFVTISPEGTDHGHSVAYMEFFERIYAIQQHLEQMNETRLEKQLSEAALSADRECDVPSDVCSENGNQATSVIPSDCASTTSRESVGSSRSFQAGRLAVPESGFASPFGNRAKDDSMALATTMSTDRSRAGTNQSRQSNGSTSAASSSNSNMAPLATPEPVEICSEYMCVKDALPNGAEPIYATVKNFETFRSNSVTANPTSRPSKLNKKISRIRGNSDKRGISSFSSDLATLSADLAHCSVPSSGSPASPFAVPKNGRSPPPPVPPKPQLRSTGQLARLQPIVENQLKRSSRLHSMSAESLLSITPRTDWTGTPAAADAPARLLGRGTKKVTPVDGGGIIRRVASSFRFKKFQPMISGPKEVTLNEQPLIVQKDSGGAGCKGKLPSSPIMGVRSVPHSPQIDRANNSNNSAPPPKPPSSNEKGSVFSWLPSRSPKRNARAGSLEVERKGPSSIFTPTDTLQGLALVSPDGIPVFVTKCITFIEQEGGLELEGLYRVPGNQAQVLQLEKAFQANSNISLSDLDVPVHAAATALKNFFLNLPSPVIPYEIQEDLITDAKLEENKDYEIRRFRRIAFDKMPKANRTLLHYFTAHINRVAARSSKNSMDMRNLAKVWWPTLFRPEFDSFEKLSGAITRLETATQFLFTHSEGILS